MEKTEKICIFMHIFWHERFFYELYAFKIYMEQVFWGELDMDAFYF